MRILNSTTDRRSLLPATQWLVEYQVRWLKPDLVAGITLAAYAVPVSMAYASLAGLPPQYGIYCYLLGGLISFISDTILIGFKAGAALTIAMTQLPKLFGVQGGGEHFVERAWSLAKQLDEINAFANLPIRQRTVTC